MSTYYYLGCRYHKRIVGIGTDKGNPMDTAEVIAKFIGRHCRCCGTHGGACMKSRADCLMPFIAMVEGMDEDYEPEGGK